MLAVTWLNSQIIFDGVVQGLGVAVIAVGVVLVYRATRIINFAVGNMGVVGAAVLSLLVVQYHVPFWVGLAVALVLGLAFGAVVDLAIIRRLRKSPRVVVLVATIGVSQLALAIAIKIPTPTADHHPLSERDQRHLDGGRCHRPRLGPVDPDHCADHAHRTDVVPRPHDARPDRQSLLQQSAARPLVRHQPEDGLDVGLGPGRRPVHTFGRPHRRSERRRRRPDDPRPTDAVAGSGGRRDRGHDLLQPHHRRQCRHRRAAEHRELQLHRQARADQSVALDHCGRGGPLQPGAHRRERGLRVHPQGPPDPRAAAILPLGPQHQQERDPLPRSDRHRSPADLHRNPRPSRPSPRSWPSPSAPPR